MGNAVSADLIGYGEPLIAPHFEEMLDYCLQRNISVCFTTNGIRLRQKDFVSRLVRMPITILLSIEGARPETHEFLRPFIKWDQMLETLKCLKNNTDEAGPERRFHLRFNFVLMKRSVADLPDLVSLASKYGVEGINLLPLAGEDILEGLRDQSLAENPEVAAPHLAEALGRAARLGIDLPVPGHFRGLLLNAGNLQTLRRAAVVVSLAWNYLQRRGLGHILNRAIRGTPPHRGAGARYCLMPWNDTYVAADGTVFPCCIMGKPLGNLLEQQKWSDIWNGHLYRNLRRTIHSWNPSSVCRYCTLPPGINGGEDRRYERFFSGFRVETLSLGQTEIQWGLGFSYQEFAEDGQLSHRWMGKKGVFRLDVPPEAKFLRVLTFPMAPVNQINPGRLRVNGGTWEAFDNTCEDLHFPVTYGGGTARVEIEMEKDWQVAGDERVLAFPIRELAFLF
ncbi:SPASM domain-containing protein [bacterium]|nr:SPASM domain-containing protein [bacterium]